MKPNIYNQQIFSSVTSAKQFAELANMIRLMYKTILENQKSITKHNNIVI